MTDIAREKYERLMARIAELEELVEDLETQLASEETTPTSPSAGALRQELVGLSEELARKRSELSRISNGCGKPHCHGPLE